ncbi:IS200/IS605 family transposase [Lacihabitans sp. LS3-19]|nr:IS200/IS605 family transposase [Lacihabitans sp. LS3-19]
MGQSLIRNYVHIVFSTKYRQAFIDDNIEEELFNYLGGVCKNMECNPIKVGGYRDHVHILCLLSQKVTLAKLLEEVKKNSSKWMKTKGKEYQNFYWQNGYGAFSVKPSDIEIVERYIINQKTHHQKQSFQTEYRKFLKKYKVEYDERYVWD